MLAWREKRQLLFGGTVLFIFILCIVGLYLYVSPPASCQNGKKDTGELGVDCGGICSGVCKEEAVPLIVSWAKALPLGGDSYDLAALVENPNPQFGVGLLRYRFEVRDRDNILILERDGSTFANPGESFIVFEPTIEFAREPRYVFLTIEGPVNFTRFSESSDSLPISVRNQSMKLLPSPSLGAVLQNQGPVPLQNIEARAVISSSEDSVVGVSSTLISEIPSNGSKEVLFTWPAPFLEKPQVCTSPLDVVLLFDRSGSMNDEGGTPAEPLYSAQNAARLFVESLSPNDQIGLISFATLAEDPIDSPLSKDHSISLQKLEAITIPKEEEVGATNMAAALSAGEVELSSSRRRSDAKAILILFTDGLANAPSGRGENAALEAASRGRAAGITIYTIGLGRNIKSSFLETIAGQKNRFYQSVTKEDLNRIYQEVASAICPERTYLYTVYSRTNYVETLLR